ncbi:hypothetical protein ACLMJK_005899 [Lecanora helva]
MTSPSMPSYQQDYFGDHVAVVSSQGECRSRRKSRSKIRAYLYGSNSEAVQSPSDGEEEQSTLAVTARDVRKRLSRTGSSIMYLQSAKASTAHLSDASSSRLQASGSQSSDAEESAILADQIKERAYKDRIAAQNHVTSPIDESKHVDSVMAPVRRKSLYTPGLATRHPSDILKKPPQTTTSESHVDHDYYYNPSKPKESPLSQLAALQLDNDGRSTPSSINYPQLGGLQLGTLRVTNGIASPVPWNRSPDVVCRSPSVQSKVQDEYYTASEGSVTGGRSPCLPQRCGSPLRIDTAYTISSSMLLNDADNKTPRVSSSLTEPDYAVSQAHEYMAELGGSPFVHSGSSAPTIDRMPDEALLIPEDDGPAAERWRKFIDDAEARQYGSETQQDAFRKLNGNELPNLEPRSSASFSKSSRYSDSNEILHMDSGYGSYASLEEKRGGLRADDADSRTTVQEAHQGVLRNDPSSFNAAAIHEPKNKSDPDFRQMNLMSDQGRYSLEGDGPLPLPYPPSNLPLLSPQAKVQSPPRSSLHKSMRKLQKPRPKSQPLLPVISGQGPCGLAEAQIPRVPSIIATKHAERLRQFPLLDHTFPSSQHTHLDDVDYRVESNDLSYPLLIRFPSPALEAAVVGDLDEVGKSRESERSQSRARSKSTGKSALREKGQWSRSRASSKHRESVAEQFDDEWPASGIMRSPSWSDFGRGRRSKEQKKMVKQEKEAQKRLAREEKELEKRCEKERSEFEKQIKLNNHKTLSARPRPTSKGRGRSTDRSGEAGTITIADLGTVTESLGQSPYDIATSMISRTSYDASIWHPHQISTAMPRPKSVIGMDEAAASEVARARRQARSQSFVNSRLPAAASGIRPKSMFVDATPTPALAAVDLDIHGADRAKNCQEARVRSRDECDAFLGRSTIAQSVHGDVPPVPALPTVDQVKQREAQLTKSRPQSMLIDDSPPSPQPRPVVRREGVKPAEHSIPDVSKSSTLTKSEFTRARKIVPDLWTSGSLERKTPHSAKRPKMVDRTAESSSSEESTVDQGNQMWEAQRQAWKQRRESAGEALLRNQIGGSVQDHSTTKKQPKKQSPMEEAEHTNFIPVRASTPECEGTPKAIRPALSHPASFPNPLRSHPSQQQLPYEAPSTPSTSVPKETTITLTDSTQQSHHPGPSFFTQQHSASSPQAQIQHSTLNRQHRSSTFTIPRKSVGSNVPTPTKSIDRLTGRYDGGLLYGYEPGCGLGGSAGTRGTKTEASRKSVEVSRGFGLDLSDVPVFVAPATAAR